ncbi:hypothetical protein SteCoe_24281 [Stentor coeruleus]|uniref:Arginase n=1 Tax=Stentor coeruleus TaxID=5963 RepID=A0A1R2BHZ0_9CILI|nr:hypothetical protein SteCoe_24281 [Stentor coeruleus]
MEQDFSRLNFSGVPNFKRDDPKLGTILQQGLDGDVVIIGFPYDEGVQRNGGRPGTSKGPSCLRNYLPKIGPLVNPEYSIDISCLKISDSGDISGNSFNEAHDELKNKVKDLIDQKKIPIIIGGGKDQSWSCGQGFLKSTIKGKPIIVNIDSHLDVRPLDDEGRIHSGCAFRILLEDQTFINQNGLFYQFGAQGSQCGLEHVNFVRNHGGEIVWMRDIRASNNNPSFNTTYQPLTQAGRVFESFLNRLQADCKIIICLELDVIAARDCPGVSCPSVDGGLTSEEALELMLLCGKDSRVLALDLAEYNPIVEEYLTGRLLSNMVYFFIMGYKLRTSS